MRRGSGYAPGDDEGSGWIDLTPMLDVSFIILIFFIVTASLVKGSGVAVDRPPAVTGEQQQRTKLAVAVTGDDRVWIEQGPVDPPQLRLELERLRALYPRGGLVVQADRHAGAGAVAAVLAAAREAGIEDVAVSTRSR